MEQDISKLIDNAYNLHVNGKYEEAKKEYEQLLKVAPDNFELQNLYAQLNFVLGNYDIALEGFLKLYEKLKLVDIKVNIIKIYIKKKEYENAISFAKTTEEKDSRITRLLASANTKTGNFDAAEEYYLSLINSNEANKSDILNFSLMYLNKKDYASALKYAMRLYEQNKNDVEVILYIASVYLSMNDTENQIKMLLEAVKIRPNADIYCSLGVAYKANNDNNTALEYFEKALIINPEHKKALLNKAVLIEAYDTSIAVRLYEELYFKYPEDNMVLLKLYKLSCILSNYEAAAEAAKELIKLNPDNASYYVVTAETLLYCGKYEESLNMFKAAKEKGAENCIYEIANLYSILNMQDKVNEILKDKVPETIADCFLYASSKFRAKDFESGKDAMHENYMSVKTEESFVNKAVNLFYKYKIGEKSGINEAEFRMAKSDNLKEILNKKLQYKRKDLYGHTPDNKKIFVYSGDGAGDLIMFSRYLNILSKHTNDITLSVPKSMYELIKQSFPQFNIIEDTAVIDVNDYDYTSSFFCLLMNLKENSFDNIPYSSGYLYVDDKLVEEKKTLEVLKTNKKKIGIFWQGNPGVMSQRSIKLEFLKPLFEIPDSRIYSFQMSDVDDESEQLKKELPLIDVAPYIKDYSDTAAFLKNIDVLVSIDTSIANLGGALGVKTFLMLPFEAEWRWFYDTDKTPWYDSVKIFKQTIPYDWSDVVERIKKELSENI